MSMAQTERLGVAAADYFFSQQGWLFREQPTHDYGIDAHIEIVVDEKPTGKLVALQIKSGKSFFSEETEDAYIFRTDDQHVAYWVNHSMPVVLLLFDPDTKQAYWQSISREIIESTGKQWKISVPKENILQDSARTLNGFASLTQPEPYIRRLNRLRVDRRWMDLIAGGADVRVEFDDWVNKSLPRYQITISTDGEEEKWPTMYAPGVGIEAMLAHFFPWADFSLDEEAYYEFARAQWDLECYSGRDQETGEVYYTQSFEEWHESPDEIVPVSENGETATYSLILSLNDFGRSFLEIDDYLADPDAPESIGFPLE